MLNLPLAAQAQLADNSRVRPQVRFGSVRIGGVSKNVTISDSRVIDGSLSFTDGTSSSSTFDIGAAVMGKVSFELRNDDGYFDDWDFGSAEYARVAVLVDYYSTPSASTKTTATLYKGYYKLQQPDSYGRTIGITGYDYMSKFERPYSEVTTKYPATLQTIMRGICSKCGVTLASATFPNYSYVVQERPDDSNLNCMQMVSYIAQVAGCFAKVNVSGALEVKWYDTSSFEGEDWLDGGTYNTSTRPYSDGDAADGGAFSPWTVGAVADGGTFGMNNMAYAISNSALRVATDDVVITGISVKAQDGEDGDGKNLDGETHLSGSTGYVLSVEGNPLILYGQAKTVADYLAGIVVGMQFRPFDVSTIGNPCIEAGDPIILVDAMQRQYSSFVTQNTYKAGAYQALKCGAETPQRNQASVFSAQTKAIVDLRNQVKQEISDRALAIESLGRRLDDETGLFETEQPAPGGGVIRYIHDQPTIAESRVVWKMTADAIGVSTDGGVTYPIGLDATGDAVLNRIYAIGLDAGYINTGRLEVSDSAGNIRFLADCDTGQVLIQDPNGNMWNTMTGELRMTGGSTLGGRKVDALLSAVDATISSVDVQYAQNQSQTVAPTSGWKTTAPAWREGWYIWQRTATTNPSGTRYSTPTCISGRDGEDGTSVKILGSYNTLAELKAAHPTGNDGDGYLVGGDLYVWNGTQWQNVGTIKGPTGATGVGVSAIVEQYYLSTSSTTQTGGSWSTSQPAWTSGKYIWTRSLVTWTDGRQTTTSPVLAKAINGANLSASTANTTANTAKSTADATKTAFDALNTQEGIFNKLTNNGQTQGIYLSGGKLYINAEYIKAGIIADGKGKNSWNLATGAFKTDSMTATNINASGVMLAEGTKSIYDTGIWFYPRTKVTGGFVEFYTKDVGSSTWKKAGAIRGSHVTYGMSGSIVHEYVTTMIGQTDFELRIDDMTGTFAPHVHTSKAEGAMTVGGGHYDELSFGKSIVQLRSTKSKGIYLKGFDTNGYPKEIRLFGSSVIIEAMSNNGGKLVGKTYKFTTSKFVS